ncbi:MAG TPA: class I SAM-dependent methyltransferase [Nitrospiraceae bacterium]|nr:class I SAM-dependent methyltransferase [Nitrospiraceae bacterium]
MVNTYTVWKNEDHSKAFLEQVRGAIPFSVEQVEIMLRIIGTAVPQVRRFLDLGCGDGILGRSILSSHPAARGIFVDFSETMISAAKRKCDGRCEFITTDLAHAEWTEAVRDRGPFDVIVSGFAIHHLPDTRKRELYQEVFDLLGPEGVFLNLEHVSSASKWLEALFEEQFVDSLFAYHRRRGSKSSREQIAQEFYSRPDKKANILAPVDVQCAWLREIGFQDVDCYFKVFELALFGGRKPR